MWYVIDTWNAMLVIGYIMTCSNPIHSLKYRRIINAWRFKMLVICCIDTHLQLVVVIYIIHDIQCATPHTHTTTTFMTLPSFFDHTDNILQDAISIWSHHDSTAITRCWSHKVIYTQVLHIVIYMDKVISHCRGYDLIRDSELLLRMVVTMLIS